MAPIVSFTTTATTYGWTFEARAVAPPPRTAGTGGGGGTGAATQKSRLTASLQAGRQCNGVPTTSQQPPAVAPAAELGAILQGTHCSSEAGMCSPSPVTTFLGVSPPVRSSGAANPWGQSDAWKSTALSASRTNLAALQELCPESGMLLSSQLALMQQGTMGSPMVGLGFTPEGAGSWCEMGMQRMAAAAAAGVASGSGSCRTQESSRLYTPNPNAHPHGAGSHQCSM